MNWLKKLFGMGKKEESKNEGMENVATPQEPQESQEPSQEEGGDENIQ